MTFRQLEYVIEIANQGSISVAARKLMISQPSLSQSLRSIEKEFNITLFDRTSSPLVPTKAGSIFLNKAHVILAALEDMNQELAQTETTPEALRIGISDSGALINKHIFQEFQIHFPNTKLLLVERDQYMLERMLEAGKLDMIFSMIPYDNPNIEIIPLVEDEMLVAIPKNHPVARRALVEHPDMLTASGRQSYFPMINLEECRDIRFVLSGRDRLKFTQLSALRSYFEPEIGFETDTLSSAVAISAYEPHGTVVPKLFSTLYDGPDRPYFFHCKKEMPIWSFTLSLKKNFRLSNAEFYYIQLFLTYIDNLGLLSNDLSVDELLAFLRKKSSSSGHRKFTR